MRAKYKQKQQTEALLLLRIYILINIDNVALKAMENLIEFHSSSLREAFQRFLSEKNVACHEKQIITENATVSIMKMNRSRNAVGMA